MQDRTKSNSPECWNGEAIKDHVAKETEKENANMQALPKNVYVDVGQVGCSGCIGDSCTATISRTIIRPTGMPGIAVGPVLDELPMFERRRPEADVIKLRQDAA